jgi:hypothetical protein
MEFAVDQDVVYFWSECEADVIVLRELRRYIASFAPSCLAELIENVGTNDRQLCLTLEKL